MGSFPISITIPRTFFITGLGRSGTKFLATVLNRSMSHIVLHEHPPEGQILSRIRWFPIGRFVMNRYITNRDKGYGEINSHYRHSLSPEYAGREAMIERRGIVFRDPRDVIASALNRQNRTINDFDHICRRVLFHYNRLLALRQHPILKYEVFLFSEVTSDWHALQRVAAWAGIVDINFSEADTKRKINVNKTEWFPRWGEWDRKQKEDYRKLFSSLVTQADIDELGSR